MALRNIKKPNTGNNNPLQEKNNLRLLIGSKINNGINIKNNFKLIPFMSKAIISAVAIKRIHINRNLFLLNLK